ENGAQWQRTGGLELRKPAPVVLALEREAAILESRIHSHLVVIQLLHRDTRGQCIGVERVDSVGEFDLRGVGRHAIVGVAALAAVAGRYPEPRGRLLMVFEVAQSAARAELARGWHPVEAGAVGEVSRIVARGYAELADIRVDRCRVVEPRERFARDEDAGREPAAKELLRHLPIARPPKWPRTLHRADREVGGYADAEAEPSTKTVLEVAKQQGLLGRRQRPERDVVAKPRHREEPRQPHKCAMPVEVVAR